MSMLCCLLFSRQFDYLSACCAWSKQDFCRQRLICCKNIHTYIHFQPYSSHCMCTRKCTMDHNTIFALWVTVMGTGAPAVVCVVYLWIAFELYHAVAYWNQKVEPFAFDKCSKWSLMPFLKLRDNEAEWRLKVITAINCYWLLSRTGTVGCTEHWVKVPKCALIR